MEDSAIYTSESEIESDGASETDSLLHVHASESQEGISSEQLTQNPTATATQAAKAIEAAQERRPAPIPDEATPAVFASSSRLPDWADEQTPLLDAGPAPPDYAAATAWRRSQPSTEDGNIDSTARGPAPQYHSEGDDAIGSTIAGHQDSTPFLNGSLSEALPSFASNFTAHVKLLRRNKRARRFIGALCKFLCLLNILAVVFGVIAIVIVIKRLTRKEPITWPIPDTYHPAWTTECPFDTYSDYYTFGFESPPKFGLSEHMTAAYFPNDEDGVVSGSVNILRAPPEQMNAIQVWVHFANTAPYHVKKVNVNENWDGLTLSFPLLERNAFDRRSEISKPCLDTWIGIYVRPDMSDFSELYLTTINMNILFNYTGPAGDHSGEVSARNQPWPFNVKEFVSIISDFGNVSIPYLDAPTIHVDSLTGSIISSLALRNDVSLRTETGAINASVVTKNGSTEPAKFFANTTTGPIHVDFPLDGLSKLPERKYEVLVQSVSGDISGEYILGNASFITVSGSIDVDLLPYSLPDLRHTLTTVTIAGDTSLNILAPLITNKSTSERFPSSSIRLGSIDGEGDSYLLDTAHQSQTGNVSIIFSQDWEGLVDGITSSGSVELKGKGLKLLMDEFSPILHLRHVKARKGKSSSKTEFITLTGDVAIVAGEV